MANYRKLFVNWDSKQLQSSDKSGYAVVLPAFNMYETIPFQVTILADDPDTQPTKFNKLDIADMSLKMTINDSFDTASPLAETSGLDWSKDTSNRWFRGELALNTSAMNTYIGSSDVKTAYFEIEITEGASRSKIYRTSINLKQAIAQVTTTSPDPSREYYDKLEQDGRFLTARLKPGVQLTFVSADESYEYTIGVSNDGEPLSIGPFPV